MNEKKKGLRADEKLFSCGRKLNLFVFIFLMHLKLNLCEIKV